VRPHRREVLAIAEHEHLPEVAATARAQYLLSREHGSEKNPERVGKHFLGYARFPSPQPQSGSDVTINGVGKTV
jgi:hypothetical protein